LIVLLTTITRYHEHDTLNSSQDICIWIWDHALTKAILLF
jgi:hypothetical protein